MSTSSPIELSVEERDREISRMDTQVRGRVRKNVKHNMKIVIRGDRGTGKTSLWRRFQGLSYSSTVLSYFIVINQIIIIILSIRISVMKWYLFLGNCCHNHLQSLSSYLFPLYSGVIINVRRHLCLQK